MNRHEQNTANTLSLSQVNFYYKSTDQSLPYRSSTVAELLNGIDAIRRQRATESEIDCQLMYKSLSGQAPQYLADDVQQRCLSLTADDVGCDLPVTEPVSLHRLITVSAAEASLLLDPQYGMLYRQNSDMTSALDSLCAN